MKKNLKSPVRLGERRIAAYSFEHDHAIGTERFGMEAGTNTAVQDFGNAKSPKWRVAIRKNWIAVAISVTRRCQIIRPPADVIWPGQNVLVALNGERAG
jgi:hypothetical protein